MRISFLVACLFVLSCKTISSRPSESDAELDPKKSASDVLAAFIKISSTDFERVKVNIGNEPIFIMPAIQSEIKLIEDSTEVFYESTDKYREVFSQELIKGLPPNLKKIAFVTGMPLGLSELENIEDISKLEFMQVIFGFLFYDDEESRKVFLEPKVLDEAFRYLVKNDLKVSYDGVSGSHIYQDSELELNVNYLIAAMVNFPADFFSSFDNLPNEIKQKIMTDVNDASGASRAEPSDLLKVKLKFTLMSDADKDVDMNMPFASQLASQMVDKYLKRSSTNDPPYALLRNSALDPNPAIMCASMLPVKLTAKFKFQSKGQVYSSKKLVQTISFGEGFLEDSIEHPDLSMFILSCDGKEYKVVVEPFTPKPVKKPVLNFKGDIHGISSVALVYEMNNSMLAGGLGYLVANGYLPTKVEDIADTKKEFMTLATNGTLNRVVLPVGHAFNQNETQLGRSRSIKITAQKKIAGNTVYLHIFLPPLKNPGRSESLSAEDMKQIICSKGGCDGLQVTPSGVAVMTTSCHSSSTIEAWMMAYYQAIKESEKLPTPTVFASDEGFDTDNPFTIVSHLDHIFRFMEGIANGKSPDALKDLMDTELQPTTARRLLRQVKRYYGSSGNFQDKYTPVCNADDSRYFEGRYKVYNISINKM